MKKLLCENPEIEKTIENSRIIYSLERAGFAKRIGRDLYVVDWQRARMAKVIRGIAKKGDSKIEQWAQSAQQSVHVDAATPYDSVALCPHCGKPIILVAPEPPRQ